MAPSYLPSWTWSFYGVGTLQFRSAEDLVLKNRDIRYHTSLCIRIAWSAYYSSRVSDSVGQG